MTSQTLSEQKPQSFWEITGGEDFKLEESKQVKSLTDENLKLEEIQKGKEFVR